MGYLITFVKTKEWLQHLEFCRKILAFLCNPQARSADELVLKLHVSKLQSLFLTLYSLRIMKFSFRFFFNLVIFI